MCKLIYLIGNQAADILDSLDWLKQSLKLAGSCDWNNIDMNQFPGRWHH